MKTFKTRYSLINTFHNTTVGFIGDYNADGATAAYTDLCHAEFSSHKDTEEYKISHRKLLRIKKVLCGDKHCHCGAMIVSA